MPNFYAKHDLIPKESIGLFIYNPEEYSNILNSNDLNFVNLVIGGLLDNINHDTKSYILLFDIDNTLGYYDNKTKSTIIRNDALIVLSKIIDDIKTFYKIDIEFGILSSLSISEIDEFKHKIPFTFNDNFIYSSSEGVKKVDDGTSAKLHVLNVVAKSLLQSTVISIDDWTLNNLDSTVLPEGNLTFLKVGQNSQPQVIYGAI